MKTSYFWIALSAFGLSTLASAAVPVIHMPIIGVPVLSAPKTCADLQVAVLNATPVNIGGAVWENTGNVGSGYGETPSQTLFVNVHSTYSPQVASVILNGDIQTSGGKQQPFYYCNAEIPNMNGCPDPRYHATMKVVMTGNVAVCSMSVAVGTLRINPRPMPMSAK